MTSSSTPPPNAGGTQPRDLLAEFSYPAAALGGKYLPTGQPLLPPPPPPPIIPTSFHAAAAVGNAGLYPPAAAAFAPHLLAPRKPFDSGVSLFSSLGPLLAAGGHGGLAPPHHALAAAAAAHPYLSLQNSFLAASAAAANAAGGSQKAAFQPTLSKGSNYLTEKHGIFFDIVLNRENLSLRQFLEISEIATW